MDVQKHQNPMLKLMGKEKKVKFYAQRFGYLNMWNFVEIDHEMISTVILFPSADSLKKGCCQLQATVCARIAG